MSLTFHHRPYFAPLTCAAKSMVRNKTARSPIPPPISTVTPSLPPCQTSSRSSPEMITDPGLERGGGLGVDACSGVCTLGGVAISVRSMAEPGVLAWNGRERREDEVEWRKCELELELEWAEGDIVCGFSLSASTVGGW